MLYRRLGYAYLLLTLSACAHKTNESVGDIAGPSLIPSTSPWQAKGKMLIATDEQRQTLRFTWRHRAPDNDRIVLSDSLGLKRVVVINTAGGVFIEDSAGRRSPLATMFDADETSPLRLVAPSDVASLLTGAPPTNENITRVIEQWSMAEHYRVPKKIKVTSIRYTLNIVVSQWDLMPHE